MKNTQYVKLINNRIDDFFWYKIELMKLANIDEFKCEGWKQIIDGLLKVSNHINNKYGTDRIA